MLTRSLAVRRVRMENIELHQAVGMYELSKAIVLALDFDTVLQKVADAGKARTRLCWRPEVSFATLVQQMVDHDLALWSQPAAVPTAQE